MPSATMGSDPVVAPGGSQRRVSTKTAGASPAYARIVVRTVRSWPSSATVAARAAASAAAFAAPELARPARGGIAPRREAAPGAPAMSAARSPPSATTASQSAAGDQLALLLAHARRASRMRRAHPPAQPRGGRGARARALDGELRPALAQVGEETDDLIDLARVPLEMGLDEVPLAEQVDRAQAAPRSRRCDMSSETFSSSMIALARGAAG